MNIDEFLNNLPPEVIAYINAQDEKIRLLEQQIAKLTEQFLLLQKKVFGIKSEKSKYIVDDSDSQLNTFNEVEETAEEIPAPPEPEIITVKRKKKPKRTKADLAKKLPVVKEVIDIPENERECGICNGELHKIGVELVRRELEIIPAQVFIKETYCNTYACKDCEKETDEANIVKPEVPAPIVKRGLASASSATHVIYQKFVNAMPLYRQEKDWGNFDVIIHRGTLANWIIYIAKHWLTPLWLSWKLIVVAAQIKFADETVVQVLKEPGKKPQSESRMWCYATGRGEIAPIVLYEYKPDRRGENAKQFLAGASGFYLHTDGYAGYDAVEGAIHVGCWQHLRRKFTDAMPKNPPKDNPAYIGFTYCQKLFELERSFDEKNLTAQERYKQRLEKSKPVMDDFFKWVKTLEPLAGSKLATAVTYAKNQEERLLAVLLNGNLDISTNRVENAIRPFAVGRKNWLFSDTVAGAESSAITYSVIETVKLNGINPYEYLLYISTNLPTVLSKDPNADLSDFQPWSPGIAERCLALKEKHNRTLVHSQD